MTTRARALEVDTQLAALYEERWAAVDRLAGAIQSVHYAARDRRITRSRWGMTDDEAIAVVRTMAEDTTQPWNQKVRQDQLAAIGTWQAAIARADESIRPFVDEYDADRWPRFFLVDANGGHIHSSMHCSTCYPTTRYGWLPQLSGLTEEDAVADQGPRLCSVCYPSAPVEWTLGLPSAPRCPGSGLPAAPGRERYASQPCSVCGKSYPVSDRTGLVRAHKPVAQS